MDLPYYPTSFLSINWSSAARNDRAPAAIPEAKEQQQDDATTCDRHPDQRVIGLCASCLRERLLQLKTASRLKPSFFSALKSAVFCKTATPATTIKEQRSCDDDEEVVMEPRVENSAPRERTHNSFSLAAAASALNKKLQKWKSKRKLKKIKSSSSTRNKVTVDPIDRLSSVISPRFSLDFEIESVLPARLPPVLTMDEDTDYSPAARYGNCLVPPKKDVRIPGGVQDTRNYYSDFGSSSELSELIKKRYCSESFESAWNIMYQGGSSSTGGGGSGNNAKISSSKSSHAGTV